MNVQSGGCPFGFSAASMAQGPSDASLHEPPEGFSHFLGQPSRRFRWRGRDPRLDPASFNELLRDVSAIARAMTEAPEPRKEQLPSGYTYALQLVAHDMVDTVVPLWAVGASAETRNQQSQPLRLDTIYGGGPGRFPLAYDGHSESGLHSVAFRMGPMRAQQGGSALMPPGRDIPRAAIASDGTGAQGLNAALLADMRNDQHFMLSQTVFIFMALHNAILSLLPPIAEAGVAGVRRAEEVFACAHAATVLIYREILRQDLLPRVLHPAIRPLYAACQPLMEHPGQERGMPLEFSHGAFRFGHAMVRGKYALQSSTNTFSIDEILNHTSAAAGIRFPLETKWLVNWANFLPISGTPANLARPIGATANPGFGDKFRPINGAESKVDGVAIRDLMSAGLAGLWSVWPLLESIARDAKGQVFADPLRSTRTGWPAALKKWNSPLQGASLPPDIMAALEEDPPFPFFVLLEAATTTDQAGLGPLGSIIIAETIASFLARDPLPAELQSDNLRERLRWIGQTHGAGDALDALPEITSLVSLLRFLATTSVWRNATPPLFSAA